MAMINSCKFKKAEKEIIKLLGKENVLTNKTALLLNSFDGSPVKSLPEAVLEIKDISKLPRLIHILNKHEIPFVPRAAATNHDGGAIPLKGGAVLNLNHLDNIEQINTKEKYADVQCATVNGNLQKRLDEDGFFYAPDPASKEFSTIGGNCALGAGGPKTLKYGATLANVLKAQFILPDGTEISLSKEAPGPDLLSLLLRSEGTLGLITKLRVKIHPKAPFKRTFLALFPSLSDTMLCVKDIIAAGIIPSALEALDQAALKASRSTIKAQALLIIEIDGEKTELPRQAKEIALFCKKNKAVKFETAIKESERLLLWQSRLSAAAALASLGSGLFSLDCAVSRTLLPAAIEKISAIFAKYRLKAGIVFHAGDGNIHPNIAFDENNLYELSNIKKAIKEIHQAVCSLDGTISAEHGVGVEKRAALALMFDDNTLKLFSKIKNALDPKHLANPDKVLPIASRSAKKLTPPSDIMPIVSAIKHANETGSPLNIVGLNTKLELKKGAILSLAGFNRITEIDKTNYTVTVQPGITVKDLDEVLRKQNLHLPIAPCKGSIGGAFSAKTIPSLKDFVTGLDIVLPDGSFVRYGGKFVKNTAGYDLIALMCGARGAYGAVTSLTLRLLPRKPLREPQTPFGIWRPNAAEVKLKKALDPNNILNPFIFEGVENEIKTS